jgi:hypothetical protein
VDLGFVPVVEDELVVVVELLELAGGACCAMPWATNNSADADSAMAGEEILCIVLLSHPIPGSWQRIRANGGGFL